MGYSQELASGGNIIQIIFLLKSCALSISLEKSGYTLDVLEVVLRGGAEG